MLKLKILLAVVLNFILFFSQAYCQNKMTSYEINYSATAATVKIFFSKIPPYNYNDTRDEDTGFEKFFIDFDNSTFDKNLEKIRFFESPFLKRFRMAYNEKEKIRIVLEFQKNFNFNLKVTEEKILLLSFTLPEAQTTTAGDSKPTTDVPTAEPVIKDEKVHPEKTIQESTKTEEVTKNNPIIIPNSNINSCDPAFICQDYMEKSEIIFLKAINYSEEKGRKRIDFEFSVLPLVILDETISDGNSAKLIIKIPKLRLIEKFNRTVLEDLKDYLSIIVGASGGMTFTLSFEKIKSFGFYKDASLNRAYILFEEEDREQINAEINGVTGGKILFPILNKRNYIAFSLFGASFLSGYFAYSYNNKANDSFNKYKLAESQLNSELMEKYDSEIRKRDNYSLAFGTFSALFLLSGATYLVFSKPIFILENKAAFNFSASPAEYKIFLKFFLKN